METATLIAVLLYFLVMLAIGVYGFRVSTDNASAYLLGGRQLGPAVTALSAGASDMSAWILMGLPGAIVSNGLADSWIAIGLLIGAYLNYRLVAPGLRIYTRQLDDALTLPDYFEKRFQDRSHLLRLVSSLVIIIFFTIYSASGVVAGGTLFEDAFEQPYHMGVLVTAGVVVVYTLLGGFRAVSLTDFVQGCLMFVALVLVPLVAVADLGGFGAVNDQVLAYEPTHLNLFAGVGVLAIISNLAWGLGYFGQPHIIVRFMAIRSVSDIKTARRIGMSWMAVAVAGAAMTAIAGLAYVQHYGLDLSDPETIFLLMSRVLFHPLISGFLLAAILAAIMSTISSQLLVSSSSVCEDVYSQFFSKTVTERQKVMVSRIAVALVALLAIAVAWEKDATILSLVSHAWAGFGAAFGPLILFSLFWPGMNRNGALAGMLSGAIVVLLWTYVPLDAEGGTMSDWMYEIIPGFLVSCVSIVLFSRYPARDNAMLQNDFDRMQIEKAAGGR